MADLAVIALGLDATGMKTGADQATRALTGVEKEMDAAQKRLTELQKQLEASGKSAAGASTGFKSLGGSAKDAGASLAGLGGPVGQVAGSFQHLTGQLEGLVQSFGVVGGAAIGAVAGVAALGAAFLKLTLDGVKLSDEMGDIAEVTGVSLDNVQRFAAGMKLAGEDIAAFERPLRTLQGLIKQALDDPSGEAAHTLYDLGISAKDANKDIGQAFKELILRVKELRETTAGTVATNELFGRSIGAIVRSSDQLKTTLTAARPALEDALVIGLQKGIENGQKLDTEINKLSNSWDVFKQNLAATSEADAALSFLDQFNERVAKSGSLLSALASYVAEHGFFGKDSNVTKALTGGAGAQPQFKGLFEAFQERSDVGFVSRDSQIPRPPSKPGTAGSRGETEAEKAAKRLAEALKSQEEKNATFRKKAADDFIKDMEDLSTAARETTTKFLDLVNPVETIVEIFNRAGLRTLGGAAAPPIAAGGIPGTTQLTPLAPDQILSAREARIQEALGGIFEDFVFQITTARATVGEAFKGLALGVLDTFAAEFAAAFRKSLQRSFIDPLAGWLEDALTEMFSGISGKGLGKFFKAIGTSFAGLFAEGGTIPSNHWGIVGERGPEIAFAGSSPMQISPMGGGGGMSINMNFAISTASGEVSQRTQDQIADAAARGIERASRIRGAR